MRREATQNIIITAFKFGLQCLSEVFFFSWVHFFGKGNIYWNSIKPRCVARKWMPLRRCEWLWLLNRYMYLFSIVTRKILDTRKSIMCTLLNRQTCKQLVSYFKFNNTFTPHRYHAYFFLVNFNQNYTSVLNNIHDLFFP